MPRICIADFARAMNVNVIAVLRASLDKSGTEPKGITSVAGYIGTVEEWTRVEAEWFKALDGWKIETFHLSKLPYLIGQENTKACTNYFCDILTRSDLVGVGAALIDEDWDQPDFPRRTEALRCSA